MRMRRVIELSPVLEFLLGKALEVGVPRELHRRAVGCECLDKNLAFDLAAARASCDLSEELKRALGSAEVGHVQCEIGIEHADESDIGKVESFCDHCVPMRDVDLLRAEVPQRIAELVLPCHAVGVHTTDAGLGKTSHDHHLLHALGAEAAKRMEGSLQLGHLLGGSRRAPQTWHTSRLSFLCSVIGMLQS